MGRETTDEIAREAARLLADGSVADVGDAIRAAVDRLGLRGSPRPGHGRVRQHLQGLELQSSGDRAYAERVRSIWRAADELMTALETAVADAEPRLMGRGARGEFDGPVVLYVRIHTRRRIGEIAELLETYGYAAASFETADTRYGRFDRLRLMEPEAEFVITRCLPEMLCKARVDLFKRKPVAALTPAELRDRLRQLDE